MKKNDSALCTSASWYSLFISNVCKDIHNMCTLIHIYMSIYVYICNSSRSYIMN